MKITDNYPFYQKLNGIGEIIGVAGAAVNKGVKGICSDDNLARFNANVERMMVEHGYSRSDAEKIANRECEIAKEKALEVDDKYDTRFHNF